MPVEKNLQKILMMLEEKKSLWRRLMEWAFPNFKINKKEYTVDSSRYVRYQDVTEPEKILQPASTTSTALIRNASDSPVRR